MEEKGLELDPDSEAYRALCREVLKVDIKILDIYRKRELGDYSDEQVATGHQSVQHPVPQESGEDQGIPLSQLIDHYVTEKRRDGEWTKKTDDETQSSLKLFVEYVGDVRAMGDLGVKTIDRQLVANFRVLILALFYPSNLTQNYPEGATREPSGTGVYQLRSAGCSRSHSSMV